MKQVLIAKGAVSVAEVPAPTPEPDEVLVRVRASCLSVGTEMSGVRSSGVPIWKRALRQPDKALTVLKTAATSGVGRAWNLVQEKRDAATATGYSAAGVVVEVGEGVADFVPGDRVACAGGGYAVHAEFIRVPRNLCVAVPDDLDWDSASTVTLGAIALQGVRRAQPTMGESFVVVGLGILGQLTAQLLKANGCRVIGIDLDRGRIELAERHGMEVGLHPDDGGDASQVARLTDGIGADGVIITAASPSDAIVSQAFQMCRRKGRVVLVGDVGLHLNRADFYAKEIDFLISTSYGPGRYDHRYEEHGIDYPVAYVRWTENRNMGEYLRLLADRRVQVHPLITARYAIDEATAAYASLGGLGSATLMVMLTYDGDEPPVRTLATRMRVSSIPGRIRIAVLGAGGFARSTHLPNLRALPDRFAIHAVVTRDGHNANAVAAQFGASRASTSADEVLADPEVDAVIIATRHHLHAELALAALRAGKHVLVEKPTVLSREELDALDAQVGSGGDSPGPLLMTGYNRRFSPYAKRLASMVRGRSGPFMLNYRMNAGYIPLEHWVHGPEGGGRNIGEACHIYDLFTFLAGSAVDEVTARSIRPAGGHYSRIDNFIATLRFADGSVASLTYTALGNPGLPKEIADLHVDGKSAVLRDYYALEVFGQPGLSFKTSAQDKGFAPELVAFADGIRDGEWPIPWWQQKQAADIALTINHCLVD